MRNYVRVFPNFCVEVVIQEGKFRKKRLHILINPEENLQLEAFQGAESVNDEALTHLMYIPSEKDSFEKVVEWAELLNKPVITTKQGGRRMRETGLSIRQLRIISDRHASPVQNINVIPLYKRVEWEKNVSLALPVEEPITSPNRIIDEIISPIQKIFRPVQRFWWGMNPLRKNQPSQIQSKDYAIAVNIEFGKYDILIPLSEDGMQYLNELAAECKPNYLICPHSNLSDITSVDYRAKMVMVFDPKHPREKVLLIPKNYNESIEYEVILASEREWVEIPNL